MPAAAAEQRERGGAGPGQDRHPRPGRQPHHLAGGRAGLQPGDPRPPPLLTQQIIRRNLRVLC